MNAKCSAPLPSEPSSLDNAVAANMEMKVDKGAEIAPEELDKKKMTCLSQPISANCNELLAAGNAGSQFSSTVPNTPNLEKNPVVNPPRTVRRKKRLNLFINGHLMIVDKISRNGTKTFWKCEYNNTCKAKLYTSMNTEEHVLFINEHNHRKATDEEIKLYGLDPSAIVQNKIYKIDKIVDLDEQREIRKRIGLKKAAAVKLQLQKQMAAACIQIKPGSAQVTPNRNSQELNPSSSLLPSAPALSIESSCSTEEPKKKMSQNETLECLFNSLQIFGMPKPKNYPRITTRPTIHFDFYVAKYDGTSEHNYTPMRIQNRDENLLKEALQSFCNNKCSGALIFRFSPKINLLLCQPMLCDWENRQFFLLDISNPNSWRLQYVDDQALKYPIEN